MSSAVQEAPVGAGAPDPSASSNEFDILADLRKELEQLSAANREIFEELRSDPALDLGPVDSPVNGDAEAGSPFAPAVSAEEWAEKEREYEEQLAEKDEQIRILQERVQKLEEEGLDLDAVQIHDLAVERMKAKLEEQRRQLEQDEEAMMRQTREMELALAKDRAELARHRSELQRLQADFQRELETASRDGDLRERLIALQRRHQESQGKRVVERPAEPADLPAAVAPPPPARPKSSLIRRIFGQE